MTSEDLVKAIKHILPSAEFTFNEADYSTIEWIVLDGDAPTLKEIEVAHEEIKAIEAQLKINAEAKKAAAEAKLAALGLDSDDLKALGLA
jgi:hypothetical protein